MPPDEDGNLTDDGRYTYAWDGENRLVSIQPKLPVAGDRRLSFQYDYLGRRVTKAVETYSGGGWQQTQNLYFIYDGWNVVEVVNAQTSELLTQYAWGLDLSGGLHGAGGIGGLLAAVETQGTTATADDKSYWLLRRQRQRRPGARRHRHRRDHAGRPLRVRSIR